MVNTTYCDVCNHEYKYNISRHLQTNKHTFNLFHQISPLELERKHCDICSKDVLKSSYKNHLQSQKHKKNEFKVKGNYYIENTDGAFKNHIKIRIFQFGEPGPSSIAESIEIVKPDVEKVIKKTLKEMKTLKFYMGVKMNIKRQDEEQTPYMRTDPHFITSFQDFLNSGVYEELSRQEEDVDNTVVGSGFNI